MTDTINVEEPEDGAGEEAPGEAELRGPYVEGSYGKAGKQPGRHADEEEGQYTEGDYGEAGSRGGTLEPLGGKAAGPGRFPEADLGDAGTVPGRTADSEIGQYAGDYGTNGKVGPLRKPTDQPEASATDSDD
ncbi:MAG TPA: hypothetical protein VIM40_02800 [Arthrobacter sp.]